MLIIFLTPVLIRHLWQLKTVVFLHRCLICAVLLTSSSDVWPTYFLTKWHSIPNSKLQLSTSFSSLKCLLTTFCLKWCFLLISDLSRWPRFRGRVWPLRLPVWETGLSICCLLTSSTSLFWPELPPFFGNRFLRNLNSNISLDWTAAVVELLKHSTDNKVFKNAYVLVFKLPNH